MIKRLADETRKTRRLTKLTVTLDKSVEFASLIIERQIKDAVSTLRKFSPSRPDGIGIIFVNAVEKPYVRISHVDLGHPQEMINFALDEIGAWLLKTSNDSTETKLTFTIALDLNYAPPRAVGS